MRAPKHVLSVSSGLGSAFAWKVLCDRHGPENVIGVFADVNGEHPDNYRFLAEVTYLLGSRLVKLSNDGKTIWDVMIETRFLANSRVDPCSRILKREVLNAWMDANCDPAIHIQHVGIDWTEIHRFERLRDRRALDGWKVEAPLCEPPYRAKAEAQAWLDSVGIARPKLYDMGFAHANCGGGCVKAGIGQFKLLLRADRNWYVKWWEAGEERVRQALGRDDIAILTDRRFGGRRPMTLRELRETMEEQPDLVFDTEKDEKGCGVCFVGDDPDPSLLERMA